MKSEEILDIYERLVNVTHNQFEKETLMNKLPLSIKGFILNNESECLKEHLCPNNFKAGRIYQMVGESIKVVRDHSLES